MGGAREFAIDADLVKARASDCVRELAAELLPNGREVCGFWRTGSIADDPGQSLAVTLTGAQRGMWCDHATGEGGNIIQLAQQAAFRGDFSAAFAWLKSKLGLDDLDPARLRKVRAEASAQAERSDRDAAAAAEQRRRNAHGLWLAGKPIAGTPVEAYLRTRGIPLERLTVSGQAHLPGCLAFHPELYCKEVNRKLPAMMASVVDAAGRHLATHRTWLAPDGRGGWGKADLEDAKKALGSFKGGFIPLWKGEHRRSMAELPDGVDLWASEGVEDGLSAAAAKPELRVIAAVTLGNLGDVPPPPAGGRLMIIGQRDTNPKTLEHLERAIARQQERGVEVWLTPPPAGGFKDVNEALQAERRAAA